MDHPRPLSRRQVLQTAGVLGISLPATVAAAQSADPEKLELPFAAGSGLKTKQLKPLKYEEIPGLLTKEQVTPHYQAHYGGALKRYIVIEQKLGDLYQGQEPLASDAFTFLQKDRVNRMNSILLHELYFDGLTPRTVDPRPEIRQALARRFGSLERWSEDFKACCMAANGWGILARDIVNGQLYNVASDLHEVGVIWLGQPLVVCDVYEHAFYVDYLNRKQEYVNKFLDFLDWNEVNTRWQCLANCSA